jgi:hypothetical protein
MTVHTVHLAEVAVRAGARALMRPPSGRGLDHAECLALMCLGAPSLSPDRLQLRRVAMFAQWGSEDDVDRFLVNSELGRQLARGWHVRLQFLRR